MMIPASLKVMPRQEKKIFRALNGKKGCRIKIKKCSNGPDKILMTPRHMNRYSKAKNGSILSLPFTHKHLVENSRHKGGFLPLLAAVLGPVLGGIAGGLIGKGLKTKKNGRGMYLNPWRYKKKM